MKIISATRFLELNINLLLNLTLYLTLLSSLSCHSTEPADEEKPGGRNYTWTIDTLNSGSIQTYMVSMWGSSSEDVWFC